MGRSWSLRTRFVLVAAACLLPLLGLTLYIFVQTLSQGREQLLRAEIATAEVVAQVVAATLDDTGQMLDVVAALERVRRLEAPAAEEVLIQFRSARPNLYGMFLADERGEVVAATGFDPDPLLAAPSFRDAVDRALTLGERGISNVIRTTDTAMVAITVPISSRDAEGGQPVGAVGALLSVDRLQQDVLPFARGDTVIAIVSEGEIIASQGVGLDQAALTASLAQPVAQAVAGAIGTESYLDETGRERLAAFATVPGADWATLVTQPSPVAAAPGRMLLERGLFALGLAALATLGLVLALGEWIARPLRQLTGQATAIRQGDFSPLPIASGPGEIRQLGEAFGEMSDRLAGQMADLEAARAAGDAQARQMRELNRRTIRLQEDERRRIAGDIHDAVSPLITGALYQARALQLTNGHSPVASGNGTGPDPGGDGLAAIGDLLNRATDELHNVVFALRPPDLDDLGVVAAIERYMNQVRRAGLNCHLEVEGDSPALTPEVRLAIYRIVQEALHNALRHAAADDAVVRIEATEGRLWVSIRDNGAGFNPDIAARPTSLGLLSMRERAAAIGASFAIASRPGDGTTISIERRMDSDSPDETDLAVAGAVALPGPAPLLVVVGDGVPA
ncbi:MAG: HAMP domain-containing protein [Chloroflexia bacterium]|nr:HAMP domain-containing protein [Chloroflexia bacterium]